MQKLNYDQKMLIVIALGVVIQIPITLVIHTLIREYTALYLAFSAWVVLGVCFYKR